MDAFTPVLLHMCELTPLYPKHRGSRNPEVGVSGMSATWELLMHLGVYARIRRLRIHVNLDMHVVRRRGMRALGGEVMRLGRGIRACTKHRSTGPDRGIAS